MRSPFISAHYKFRLGLLGTLLVLGSLLSPCLYALDVVKYGAPQSELDERYDYSIALLDKALKETEASYGPFKIEFSEKMTRKRTFAALLKGDLVNVFDAPTKPVWEEKLLPIFIPIRKGLMGYRIFLIHKNAQKKLAGVQNLEQLKTLVAGLGKQWSSTESMKKLGFRVFTNLEYERLFLMLQIERFDYFPRGVSEVFSEMEARSSRYPDIMIEPSKALYLPLPTYFFVSPSNPRLAERIEKGLMLMIDNGSFDAFFAEHFGDMIKMADLDNRVIFKVENPLVPHNEIFDNKKLWFR